MPITGGLRGTARTVSLHNKDLAFLRILRNAVREFPVGIETVLGLGKQIDLCFLLLPSDLGRLLRAMKNFFDDFHIAVKVSLQFFSRNLRNLFSRL